MVTEFKTQGFFSCLVLFFKTGRPTVYVAKDGFNLLTFLPLLSGLKAFVPNLHGNWNRNQGLVSSKQELQQLSHSPKVSLQISSHLKGHTHNQKTSPSTALPDSLICQ